jgi:hypothetical protein
MDTENQPGQKNSKYSENEKELWHQVLADGFNIANLFNRMADLERKVHKLEDAYYLQFPDRLEKDREFEKQFDALKISPDADPSHKKP